MVVAFVILIFSWILGVSVLSLVEFFLYRMVMLLFVFV